MRLARIHLEPIGGVAGDMLLAALCDLGADTASIRRAFRSLGLSDLRLVTRRVRVRGERALSVRSIPGSDRTDHRHLAEILELIDAADASPRARKLARRIFELLAAAEGRVHGHAADEVHLHEVGELDSILDVLGVAVALDSLGNPRVTCAPLPSGSGTVRTRHGILTCPVPVVREISSRYGIPLVGAPVVGETVTPTGIAVLAEVCHRFVSAVRQKPATVGVGAGTRRFPDRANVLRAWGWPAKRRRSHGD